MTSGLRRTAWWALLSASIAVVASTVVVVSTVTTTSAAIRDPFSPPVFASQQNGAITLIGNSQMSCPTAANGCSAAQSAAPLTSGNNEAINNDFNQTFLDRDGVTGTTNSTSADLSLPSGSVVLFAKLVWGGRRDAGAGGSAAGAGFSQVRWRPPGAAAYTTLTSTNTVAPDLGGTDGHPYQASVDVTAEVAAAANGTFWVADIQAATGADRYAGWSLVLAYRNPAAPLRDLSIFEGFADVTTSGGNNSVTIPVSGFLTPATGTVNASVGFVTWEGDRGLTGEQVLLNGTQLSDASRPATNFFNSGITNAGVNVAARNANFANNFGVDVATVVANGVLPNNATSTSLVLTTNREFFYPGIVTTQIDLYTPAFNPVSKTATNLANHSPSQIGDTLQYELTFTNTGADFADNVVVTDVLAPNQTFVPGSISVTASPGSVNNGNKTDAAGDDIAEYLAASRTVRLRVGTGATATAGGTLAPNATVTMRFRATLDRSSAGTSVLNNSSLSYRARTIARDFTYTGNVVSTPVAALADLAVTKTSAPTAVNAGGTVQYPIVVTNNGPNAAEGVTVVDTLPAGLTFVSAVAPPGTSCSATGQVVTCTAGTMTNGSSLTFTVAATVPAGSTASSAVNSARVSSSTSDDVPANDSASATTTITRSADLVATKSGPAGTVNAGDTVTYTIGATNNGPSTATTVRLSDAIPVGTTLDSATPITSTLGSCAQEGGSIVCTVAALAPGQTMSATFVLVVGSGFSASTLANTASVNSAITDPNQANNTASVSTTIGRAADLAVTKSVAPGTVNAGTGTTYTIVVTNNGPSDAQGVTVTDPAVTGITLTSAASSRGTCTITTGSVSCAIGLLSPGSSATITVGGAVDPTFAGTSIVNSASASSTTSDPFPGNNSATATLSVTRSADVAIVKTGPPTITAGGQATYTLTITNAGPSQATGVTATDVLPTGLTFASSASGCTASGATVTCAVGVLASGASTVRTFVVNASATVPATVANTATVAAATTDPNAANNSSTFTSGGANPADVSMTKSIAPATLVAGSEITYTMVVTNNGPSTATGVALTDTIPAGVTITGATWPAGTCIVAAQIQCAIGTVDVGAPVTVTATGTIAAAATAGTVLANTAVVSSTSTDPTSSNNTATASGTVTAVADVGVLLTALQPTITAGSVETYKVRFFNNGPSVARNVVLTGQVPPGLVPIIGSSGGACVLTDQIVTCQVGDLPPGFTTTDATDITLQATVLASQPAGPILGTAFAGSDTPDSNPTNNQDPETIQVTTSADLAMTKTAPANLVAGGEATFTLTVLNQGPSDATDVAITDTLPTALSLVSTSPSVGTCSAVGQVITCTAARLPQGSSMVVSIKVAVSTTAPSPVVNTASVRATTSDPAAGNDSSTTTTPVIQAAHLTVSKAVAPSPAVAGAAVTYSVTIANSGPSNATSVALTDTMPAGVLVLPGGVTVPADGSCTVPTDRASVGCTFAVIPAGQSRIVTIDAAVPAGIPAGASITNAATVTSPTPDPDPTGRTTSITTPVTNVADVEMLKTLVGTAVDAGDEESYQLAVTNNGPSDARGVTIDDPLPAGTTFVSATPTNGTCTTDGGTLSCTIGDLTPGQVATVQLTVLLAANLGDTDLTNTATTTSSSPDSNPANNTSSVTQRVTRRADLALTKEISSGSILAGAPLTYSFTLRNDGPSDTVNARILDPIPAGTTFNTASASDGGTCTLLPLDATTTPITPAQVRCTWPQLAAGDTRSATITLDVPDATPAGTNIRNVATADSSAIDPTSESVTVDGPVVANSDLSLTKALISGTPIAGGTVRWQLVARNGGPAVATGVTVADTAPPGVVFDAVTTTAGTCTVGAAPLCTVESMPVGGVVTITLTGTIDPGYPQPTVTNSACLASTSTDVDLSNNTASITSNVDTSADLVVAKTAGTSTFVAGSTAEWTIGVTNVGPSTSRSAVLNDPIPAGLTNVAATSTVGIPCDIAASVSCPLGDVAAGATVTVTVRGTIAADFVAGSTTNTAGATAGTSDPQPTNNSASVPTPVVTSADVRIAKTGPPAAAPGASVTWQLTVRNDGPSVAQGVVVADDLPAAVIGPRATVGDTPCTITSGTVRCELGAVPVDDGTSATSRVITVTGTIDPATTQTSLINSASVSSPSTPDPDPSDNDASSSTTLAPRADVAISKVADASSVVPGTIAGWSIDVTNAGPSAARALTISDTVPEGVTVQSAQLTVGATSTACTVSGADVTCPIGTLAPGTPARVDLTGLIDQGVTTSTLSNTATLTSATPDPTPDDHSSTATSPVVPSADVQIRKAVDLSSGAPVAGGPIRFIVLVTNNGPSAAQTVVVDDSLPASIDPATVTVSPPACTYTTATASIQCPLGTLAVGGDQQITIDGTSLSDATEVANTAIVGTSTADPVLTNNTSTATAVSAQLADVSVAKTGQAVVLAGQRVAWTITVANDGLSDAADVVVTDTLPPDVTDVQVQIPPSAGTCMTTTAVTCTLASPLADGGSVVIQISALVPSSSPAGTLVNSVGLTSSTPDPDGGNNTASITTSIEHQALLRVSKLADPAHFVPGRDAVYTIIIANDGPSDAAATLAADTLDPILIPTSPAQPSQGTCSYTTRVLNCRALGVVPAGAEITVRVPVRVDPAATVTTLTNTATVSTSTAAPPGTPPYSAVVTSDVTPLADLTLAKSGPAEVTAGTAIAWELTVSNTGPSVATGVVVTDTLPPNLGAMAIVPSQGECTRSIDVVTCEIGNLAPGARASIHVSGNVPADSLATSLLNTASVTSPAAEPGADAADGRSSSSTTLVVTSADVRVGKRADVDSVVPGERMQWTVTVDNAGPSVARDVHITDALETGLANVAFDAPAGVVCDAAAATCDIATLLVGADAAVEIVVTADVPADVIAATLTNEVAASAVTPDPDLGNNQASATSAIRPAADMTITKSGPPDVVRGTTATWTISVTNAGPSVAREVVVDDAIPDGISAVTVAVSPTGTCTTDVSCALGDIAPGAPEILISITGTVAADFSGDDLTNTAIVTSATIDDEPPDNAASATSTVSSSARLEWTKSGPATGLAGGPISWTVTVTNRGPSVARAVVMEDPVPTGVLDVGASPSVGTCDDTIRCALGTLGVDASATITIVGTVDPAWPGGVIRNRASAVSPDQSAPDDPAIVDTDVSRSADVSIVKALASGGTIAGGPITWTITVANAGPSTAEGVVVTDVLPAAVVNPSATTTAGSCAIAGSTMTCPIGVVAPSRPVTITVTGTVAADFRGTLTNTASAATATPDPNPDNGSATVSTAVGGEFDLTISKSVDRPQGLRGTRATFTITASNVGPSTATNVVIDDQLPAGLGFVAARPSVGSFDAATRRWTVGTLAAGATVTLQMDVTLATPGTHTNVARVGQVASVAATFGSLASRLEVTPTGDTETRTDNNSASASIQVISAGSGNLPATGADSLPLVHLAASVLAAGLVLVVVTRTRRRRPRAT